MHVFEDMGNPFREDSGGIANIRHQRGNRWCCCWNSNTFCENESTAVWDIVDERFVEKRPPLIPSMKMNNVQHKQTSKVTCSRVFILLRCYCVATPLSSKPFSEYTTNWHSKPFKMTTPYLVKLARVGRTLALIGRQYWVHFIKRHAMSLYTVAVKSLTVNPRSANGELALP